MLIRRFISTLTPNRITELLTKNEIKLVKETKSILPSCIKSIECNQLGSNNPIEDRLRVSSILLPGSNEPTLLLGVFDGHGGGTTVDIISRRLFNYIAVSLHPSHLKVTDLHVSPEPNLEFEAPIEKKSIGSTHPDDVAAKLRASFKQCDDDLSLEIQANLTNPHSSKENLYHYLSAAVSGCCALVMIVHQNIGYFASVGDCRAVLGLCNATDKTKEAIELNDEHNCDNVDEIRRLTASHPKSEQNTMIRHNRLLGHLMPFRAFGDYNYKWPADIIKACGITRAFGSGVIPSNYNTPPYLIAEPDIRTLEMSSQDQATEKYLIIASDGLWEMFESSRDVVETVADHLFNASQIDYDNNCATHILRSALQSGSQQDCVMDPEELKRLYHMRLESTLSLPQSVVRNFRDDISIIVVKL